MNEQKITILIAEDDALIRKSMAHYLGGQGFEIIEAATGTQALELFREKHPDLMMTDLRIPELDGLQLLQIVVTESPETPVIIVSGMGTMTDAIEALRIGAWDYITKPVHDMMLLRHSIDRVMERAHLLLLEKKQQEELEKKVRQRTIELLQQNRKLEREIKERQLQESLVLHAKQEWERTVDAMPDMIAIVDNRHRVVRANKTMIDKLGLTYNEVIGKKCPVCLHKCDTPPDFCPHTQLLKDGKSHSVEIYEERLGGHCNIIVVPYRDPDGTLIGSVHIVRDINEQKKAGLEKERMQSQLLHAQKLESVGQLAAGIAHEINTPTQFIGTNIDFLGEAVQDITDFMNQIKRLEESWPQEIGDEINKAMEAIDWEYLAEELPLAINQSRDGVKRVTSIVRAMKEFSHPGGKEKELRNLNRIIKTTVTVARNEWKYVSEVELDLDPDLPEIPLLADEMGQVILNLLVNAAHAIGEKLGDNPAGDKGKITISTRKVENGVELRVLDTGNGIPEKILPRIFDPFFTTKKVGKGTGQGLAISHDVITEKHGGHIACTSEVGKGTEFVILLPKTGNHQQSQWGNDI